jgi:hypothetical protein
LQRTSLNNIMQLKFGRSYTIDCGDLECEDLASSLREKYEFLDTFNYIDDLLLLGFMDLWVVKGKCSDLV